MNASERVKRNESAAVVNPKEAVWRTAYYCDSCGWKAPERFQYFEALRVFTRHNVDEHNGYGHLLKKERR